MCSRIFYINIHLHFIKYFYMFIIFSVSLKTFCFEKACLSSFCAFSIQDRKVVRESSAPPIPEAPLLRQAHPAPQTHPAPKLS